MYRDVQEFRPQLVIMDPITSFLRSEGGNQAEAMLVRMIDFLKGCEITSVFTSLTHGGSALEQSEVGVSSLIDTWLVVKGIELQGERNRGLYVIKSRGMKHSNQIREFVLTDHGVGVTETYVGSGVLTAARRRRKPGKMRPRSNVGRKSGGNSGRWSETAGSRRPDRRVTPLRVSGGQAQHQIEKTGTARIATE